MDARSEIKGFLASRRGRITPGHAGLNAYGPRRVPGLRREEVAVVGGVSVPYYTRLERGDMHGVSDSVLEALARALELDDADCAHLFDLARAAQPSLSPTRRRRASKQQLRPSVQHILDAITGAAGFVRNDRLDILAANALGYALYSEMFVRQGRPANTARFIFLDPRTRDFCPDWNKAANDTVAVLRASAGRDPHDRCLSDLVGELSTQNEEFRTRWAQHNVRQHLTGIKHFHHPVVGDLSLSQRPFGPRRRPRPDHLHLHRRARLPARGHPPAARKLGPHPANNSTPPAAATCRDRRRRGQGGVSAAG